MAHYQRAQRSGDRHIAGIVAGKDPRRPAAFPGQGLGGAELHAILKMLGGGLEDSATMEIVNPATGHFWHQDGISAAGGTDDPRP